MLARWLGPIAILMTGGLFFAATGSAKPDYTRRTGKECEFCHPPNSRSLNEAGKYFQEHKNSLTGYKPAESRTVDQSKKKAAPPSKSP